MKRAHVSLILVLGAVSASLSAVDFSRGQAAPTAVDQSQICPCPHPIDDDPALDETGDSDATSPTLADTCPFESHWSEGLIHAPYAERADVSSCQFAVTPVANWAESAELIDADTAAALASHGDADWYDSQENDRGKASACVAASCPELAAGAEIDDWPGLETMVTAPIVQVAAPRHVRTDTRQRDGWRRDGWNCGGWICRGSRGRTSARVTINCDTMNCDPADCDSWADTNVSVDGSVEGSDADRYGYLQPWCAENDQVFSASDGYSAGCGGMFVNVPQVSAAVAPRTDTSHVESNRVETDHVESDHATEGWAAICGVITQPIPWMLPLSSLGEPVECPGPLASDVIGIDDIAAAYQDILENRPQQHEDVQDAEAIDVAASSGRSLVGLCLDPRHSTGNDVVRWLNRLNDGLGDEATHGKDTSVVATEAPSTPSHSELAEQKIADVGDARELPEPWWATLGVAAAADLFAAATAGVTDVPVAETAGEDDWPADALSDAAADRDAFAVDESRQQWVPPAARWAPSEWPGCGAFCDETYDVAWPVGPRHWALASDNVADTGNTPDDAVTGKAIGLMVLATSQATSEFAARVLGVAAGIARDWSVLLDGRAVQGVAARRIARRETVATPKNPPPAAASDSGQIGREDSELSPIDREQIWCDAARWPYEDL